MDTQRALRGHAFLPSPAELAVIPGHGAQDGIPCPDKTIYLHYFSAASDHWISELWQEDGQWIAFGYARLAAFPGGAEWGYLDLTELEELHVPSPGGLPIVIERDLHWAPKPFRDCGASR